MTKEKKQHTQKIGKVNMNMVKQLITWRDMRNTQLEGTKFFCTLYPDINKKICQECPETISKACFKHEWERDYIHKQEDSKGTPRRKRKQNNPKYEVETSVTENDYDDYFDNSDNDAEAKKYPCKDMYFACPDKNKCKYGKKCTYSPEG